MTKYNDHVRCYRSIYRSIDQAISIAIAIVIAIPIAIAIAIISKIIIGIKANAQVKLRSRIYFIENTAPFPATLEASSIAPQILLLSVDFEYSSSAPNKFYQWF